MQKKTVSIGSQICYAIGILGMWLLWQMLSFFLVNFYIPPAGLGIPLFISQKTIFYFLNAMAIIAFFTRFFDLVTDPIVGNLSDRWKGKKGRRMPFLKVGSLSAFVLVLVFVPLTPTPSILNAVWLTLILSLFFLLFTCYFVPYFALMVDLSKTRYDRVNLATWAGFAINVAIVLAAMAPGFWSTLMDKGYSPVASRQLAILGIAIFSFLMMLVPIFTLKEPESLDETVEKPTLKEGINKAAKNPFFRHYFVGLLFFYVAMIGIFMTGVPYLVPVLLELPEEFIAVVMLLLIVSSTVMFPIVNFLAKRIGKKILFVFGLLFNAIGFLWTSFLGYYPMSVEMQAVITAVYFGIPSGIMNVILSAICADIAEHSKRCLHEGLEGLFFAGKNIALKVGATLGISIFAAFTLLGKDVGNDLGIRSVNGLAAAICFIGAICMIFLYNEKKLLNELTEARTTEQET